MAGAMHYFSLKQFDLNEHFRVQFYINGNQEYLDDIPENLAVS